MRGAHQDNQHGVRPGTHEVMHAVFGGLYDQCAARGPVGAPGRHEGAHGCDWDGSWRANRDWQYECQGWAPSMLRAIPSYL